MPPGSSFESDLRAAREARGLSLDEIQRDTRIPVDVLRRFEEGHLVGDPSYNPVYLKAFLTSYAKAVGVPVSDVLEAYEAHQAGRYQGELGAGPTREPVPDQGATPEPLPEPAAPEAAVPEATSPEPTPGPGEGPSAPPAVEALASAPSPTPPPGAPEKRAPLTQTRVSRPAVPTARRSFDKNWGTILGLFAVLAIVLAGVLWFLVFRDTGVPEAVDDGGTVAVADEPLAAVDSAGVGAGAAGGGPQLQLPITVVVTAQGDGLQSFRVTEDADDRRPYWVEAGESETFEADSALILWGEGDAQSFGDALLEWQGQRFSPPDGASFTITAENGQRLLDSLATAPPAPAGSAPTP